MRFVIEIPDELFSLGAGRQPEATVSPVAAGAPAAAMSGGPAPATGVDVAGASHGALSAGPSQRYGGVAAAGPTPDAANDGGAAPSSG